MSVGDHRLGLHDRAVGFDDVLAHASHLRQVQVLLVLDDVEARELDLGRHTQQVELLEHERREPAGQEAERQEGGDPDQLTPERAVDVVEPGGIAGGEHTDPEHAEEAGDAVHRHRADHVVDAHLLLDPVAA